MKDLFRKRANALVSMARGRQVHEAATRSARSAKDGGFWAWGEIGRPSPRHVRPLAAARQLPTPEDGDVIAEHRSTTFGWLSARDFRSGYRPAEGRPWAASRILT